MITKKILKIAIISSLLSCSLLADYVSTKDYNIIYNTIKPVDMKGAEIKEVYFGLKDQYDSNLLAGNSLVAVQTAGNLLNGVMTAGTGVATAGFGFLMNYMKERDLEKATPIYYYYVVDIKDKNGETTKGTAMFMSRAEKYKEVNEKTINEIYKTTKEVFVK